MTKKEFLFALILALVSALDGMQEKSESSQDKNQIHYDLLGKVKKLENYDIYVGSGYSDIGEPIFFAMEKVKLIKKYEKLLNWEEYANTLYSEREDWGLASDLGYLNKNCQDQKLREQLEKESELRAIEYMNMMCSNQQKFTKLFAKDGIQAGILGFHQMLERWWKDKNIWKGENIYIAYASTQPITGPFGPKNERWMKKIGEPTYEEFEAAFPNIIISVGVDMMLGTSRAEHRGIFKNPFFEIKDTYKNIAMKLHGWAGTVEKQIFNKKYMILYPTAAAAILLHKTIKPGDMYIGLDVDVYPYNDEELKKRFPPIKQELIGDDVEIRSHDSLWREYLHAFDLEILSKYYVEQKK